MSYVKCHRLPFAKLVKRDVWQADWWKKYSGPSPAAMNPNPLSLTSRLIVPCVDAMCVSLSLCVDSPVKR